MICQKIFCSSANLRKKSIYLNLVAGYQHKPRSNYATTPDPLHQYTERFQADPQSPRAAQLTVKIGF